MNLDEAAAAGAAAPFILSPFMDERDVEHIVRGASNQSQLTQGGCSG